MEARVGARMEFVPRKRWLAPPDIGLLAILVIVSVMLHGWLLNNTFVTARDAIGFARMALNLESPKLAPVPPREDGKSPTFIDVLRSAEHPPGYAVTVLSMSYAVRSLYPAALPDQMLLSCQLAAITAGILLVFPTYLLGRSLFGRFTGFAAALMFQVLPVPARITSDGLAEALYLLCVATSLGFGVRAVRHRSTLNFLLCGMAAGLSYLVRPEGLMVILAVGTVVAWLGIFNRWPRDVAIGRLVALTVGVLLVATPYMALIGKISNKPTSLEFWNRLNGENPRVKLGSWDHGWNASPQTPVLFAAWSSGDDRALWAAKATASEVTKAAHYTPCILALVGLYAQRRRFNTHPELAILPILAIINLTVLYALGLKMGYVSERHTLLVVLITCYFAAASLKPIAQAVSGVPTLGATGLLLALVVSALPSTVRPLHENRAGHYHAGKFLESVAGPNDLIIDPFSWALFYSGKSLYFIPPDPPEARVVYAIWENTKDNPHSRLPRREDAMNVARDGWSQVVFHWPNDVPPKQARVLVYKLDGGTQDVARAVGGGLISPFLSRADSSIPRP
jgi:hypothetical protein